jgi:hypothetical protein
MKISTLIITSLSMKPFLKRKDLERSRKKLKGKGKYIGTTKAEEIMMRRHI